MHTNTALFRLKRQAGQPSKTDKAVDKQHKSLTVHQKNKVITAKGANSTHYKCDLRDVSFDSRFGLVGTLSRVRSLKVKKLVGLKSG